MSSLSIRCIKAAFCYLAIGVGMGALFAIDRSIGAWLRPLHAGLNLWGWAALLIYGFAYHMLPRFTGQSLRRPLIADAQSWLAIGGVAITALGWTAALEGVAGSWEILLAGAALQLIAALLFVGQIGVLLDRAR